MKRTLTTLVIAATSTIVVACGAGKVSNQPTDASAQTPSSGLPDVPNTDSNDDGLEPTYTFSINLGHYDATTGQRVMEWSPKDNLGNPITFEADEMFKVKITSGEGGPVNTTGYGNSNVNFGCAAYVVSAIGADVGTNSIRNPSFGNAPACPDAATAKVIDYSRRLTPGHPPIRLRVHSPRESSKFESCIPLYGLFYCIRASGWGYPTSPLRTQHTIQNIQIQVFTDRASLGL